MKSKNLIFALPLVIVLLSALMSSTVYACPCGMLITREPKTYDVIKEQQTTMILDIKSKDSYDVDLFFQMVALDTDKNVTLVFPLKQVPIDVTGDRLLKSKFRDKYKLDNVLELLDKQNLANATSKVAENAKEVGYYYIGGIFHAVTKVMFFGTFGRIRASVPTEKGVQPVARFEFEGGTLDVYSVENAQTLNDLIEQLNITLPEHMNKLIEQYGELYVGVMHVTVPPVIKESDMNLLINKTSNTIEEFRQFLISHPELKITSYDGFYSGWIEWNGTQQSTNEFLNNWKNKAVQEGGSGIEDVFNKFILSSLIPPEDVNGTEVIMKFEGSSEFYYPAGAVGSYKYKIPASRYIIRTPKDLAIDLNMSEIIGTVTYNDYRYYVVRLHSDIFGWIRQALMSDKIGDSLRLFYQGIYENASWIGVLSLFLILSLTFGVLMRLIRQPIKHSILMGLGVGLAAPIISLPLTVVIISAVKKSWKILLTGIGWLGILILFVLI